MIPRRIPILRILLAAWAATAWAGGLDARTADERAPVESLVAAERSFAARADRDGIRDAFLAFLAADSVVFRPDPIPGRSWFENRSPSSAHLAWAPEYAEISAAGDLGWTTGPSEYRPRGRADAEVLAGHFVSVWRKGPAGEWRVVLDLGIGHDRVPMPREAETRVGRSGRGSRESLMAAEDELARAARVKGYARALRSRAEGDLRVYREDRPPSFGRKPARDLLETGSPASWVAAGGDVAASGDLGFTYGTMEIRSHGGDEAARRLSFARIWRAGPRGRWRVALDIVISADARP